LLESLLPPRELIDAEWLSEWAGRELLAEDGGQTMEDGRQKQRGKSKSLSPDFLAQFRPK